MPFGGMISWFSATQPQGAIDPVVSTWRDKVVVAGGTVAQSTLNAMNTYVTGCKADATWTKLSTGVIVPFASDAFAGVFVPLVIPSGKTLTNFNFVAADYALNLGLDPGSNPTNKHIRTNIVPGDIFTVNSTQVSVYLPNLRNTANGVTFSVNGAGSEYIGLEASYDNKNSFYAFTDAEGASTPTPTGNVRLVTGSRLAGTNRIYRNGVELSSLTGTSTTLPSGGACCLFAFNDGASFYEPSVMSYAYFGQALTVAEEALHASRVQALQSALGRGA